MIIPQNATILFQGDSITDCNRERQFPDEMPPANQPKAMGHGYAGRAAAKLLARFPDQNYSIFNRGISGNRITNLRDRWETGFKMIRPDVVSILIGVNDTWHGVANGTPEEGVGLEEYERIYRQLLDKLKETFPEVKLVLCQPFVVECGAVLRLNFHPDIDRRRDLARKVAEEYADVWVPFQDLFDELVKEAPPHYWARDGVHPSLAAHERMAEFWLEKVLG